MAAGSPRELALRACADEYESAEIYGALSRAPLLGPRIRMALERAAEDERRHYEFWRGIVGECRPGPAALKAALYGLALYLFGATFVLKLLESKEVDAIGAYSAIADLDPSLADLARKIEEDERRHEAEFLSSIDEGRVKYIGFITLGISDALVELTGIYTGSLGAFGSSLSAGLTGLLAGVAASISMGVAAYAQARQEGRQGPLLPAFFTFAAYLAVVLLLAAPYFLLGSLLVAFVTMLAISFAVVAYLAAYSSVLHGRKFLAEFVENVLLILGVSLLLYVLGDVLGRALGIGRLG
ncbi:MAG: VIT1/CCC1 family protein [Desulfurococcaceae archaeon]